ncbi:MAG: ComF family protein [Deltaproteobacteria bacterium]|nr:ComF family protein [Deltaproteobacteria bacterium]
MWLSGLFTEVLNAFVPCRCHFCARSYLARQAKEPWFICPDCLGNLRYAPDKIELKTMSIFSFYDYNRLASRLLRLYKYSGHYQMASFFARLLISGIEQNKDISLADQNLIIPIPSPPKRQQQRGYNHVGLIAREISRHFHAPYSLSAISVKKTVRQQAGLNYSQRLQNLSCAFAVNNSIVSGRRVILIDDVVTTGATVTEAARALMAAGAQEEVKAVALFHSRQL